MTHSTHFIYGCSPVWLYTWLCKWDFCKNALEHKSHLKHLAPEWTSWCRFKLQRWENRYDCTCDCKLEFCTNEVEQKSHLKRLAPEWTSWCRLKLQRWENRLKHRSHWKSFALVCTEMWFDNMDCNENCREQNSHLKVFFASVDSRMTQQSRFLDKIVWADIAWFFAGMAIGMSLQCRFSLVTFATNLTVMWFFICVGHHMTVQRWISWAALPTLLSLHLNEFLPVCL